MAASVINVAILLHIFSFTLYQVDALTCYTCTSLSAESSVGIINDIISGNTNPGCENLDWDQTHQDCPSDGDYVCAAVTAKVSFLGNLAKLSVTTRGCVQSYESSGCHTGNDYVKKAVNALVSSLTESTIAGVDGEVCYCDTYLCDAKCGKNTFSIGSICLPYWAAGLIGVAALIVLILCVTCCCCCCCRPCRSSGPSYVRVSNDHPSQQSQIVMTTTTTHPGGSVSAVNPGYYMAQHGNAATTSNPGYMSQSGNIGVTGNPGYMVQHSNAGNQGYIVQQGSVQGYIPQHDPNTMNPGYISGTTAANTPQYVVQDGNEARVANSGSIATVSHPGYSVQPDGTFTVLNPGYVVQQKAN